MQVLHLPPQQEWPSHGAAPDSEADLQSVERHSVLAGRGQHRASELIRTSVQAAGMGRGSSMRNLDLPLHSRCVIHVAKSRL